MNSTRRFCVPTTALLLTTSLCLTGAGCGPDDVDAGTDSTIGSACMDVSVNADSAEALLPASLPLDCPIGVTATTVAARGLICPMGDNDWYAFSVPPGDDIVSVRLRNTATVSAVDLQYSIVASDGTTPVPNTVDFDADGGDGVTCIRFNYSVPAGDYFLVVADNDIGAGEVDLNNPYILDVVTSPDPDLNEANNSMADAVDASLAAPGYIAFKGDEDWFSFTAGASEVAGITIVADSESSVNLRYELFDAMLTPLGATAATPTPGMAEVIDELRALAGAGTYYLRITDGTDVQSDLTMSYSVTVATMADPDGNEPNDTLPGASLSPTAYAGGTMTYSPQSPPRLFAAGDVDLYYIDIATTDDTVMEINWTGTAAAPLRVEVLEEGSTTCAASPDGCVHTTNLCDVVAVFPFLDCPSFDCDLGTGTCLGAGACANGNCTITRTSREEPTTATALPVNDPGRIYVRVSARDAGAADMLDDYSLTVTLRPDPDPGDELDHFHYPDFVKTLATLAPAQAQALQDELVNRSLPTARSLTIGVPVTGALGFEGDFDIWVFPHPCPGDDCSLSATYTTPAGEVEHTFHIYDGGGGPISESSDLVASWGNTNEPLGSFNAQPAESATFAALGSSECLYASNNHLGPYYLVVRDLNLNDWVNSTYTVTIDITLSSPAGCTPGIACNTCCAAACCDGGGGIPFPFPGACGED